MPIPVVEPPIGGDWRRKNVPSSSSAVATPDVRRDQEESNCFQVVTNHPSAFTMRDVGAMMLSVDAQGGDFLDEAAEAVMVCAPSPSKKGLFVLFKVYVRANISNKKAKSRLRAIVKDAFAFARNPSGFRPVSSACSRSRRRKAEHRGCTHVLRRNARVGAPVPSY